MAENKQVNKEEQREPGWILADLIWHLEKGKDFQRVLSLQSNQAYLPLRIRQLYYPKRLEALYIHPTVQIREDLEELAARSKLALRIYQTPYLETHIRFIPDLIFGILPFGKRTDLEDKLELFTGERIITHALEPEIINKALKEVKEEGTVALIVSPYFLYQQKDRAFRTFLIEEGLIQKVVALPYGLFAGMNIDPILLILSKSQKAKEQEQSVELMDYSDFFKDKNTRPAFKPAVFLEAFIQDLEKGELNSLSISQEQIRENNYQLYPRYYFNKQNLKDYTETRTIAEVAEVFRGRNQTNKVKGDDCFEVAGKSIEDQSLLIDQLKPIKDQPGRFESLYLKKEDVLIFSKGVSSQIARVEELDGKKVIPSNNFLVIRPKPDMLDSGYLMAYLSSLDGKNRLESISKGSQVKNITTPDLLSMEIPWISLERQKEIGQSYLGLQNQILEQREKLQSLQQQRDFLFENSQESSDKE